MAEDSPAPSTTTWNTNKTPSIFHTTPGPAPTPPDGEESNTITSAPPPAVMTNVDFSLWSDATSSHKPLFILNIDINNINIGGLADIRRTIALSDQVKEYATYIFCSDKGATIADSYKTKEYLALIQGTPVTAAVTEPKPIVHYTGPSAVPRPSADEITPDSHKYSFYIKAFPSRESTAAPTLAPLDLKLPEGAKGVTELKAMVSSYVAANYAALVGTTTTYAADLREREWELVAQNNNLLKGYVVNRQKNKDGKIEAVSISNARRQAFRFKSRKISTLDLSPALVNSTSIDLRVPDFVVDDQSYVSVFETNTMLQSSFAKSSFSEASIEAAAAFGAFGATGGASLGFAFNKNDASAGASSAEKKLMNIAYNFPRVMLFLDEECLELTVQCADDLAKVTDQATLEKFCSLYGELFVTRVQIGGRLFSSDDSASISGSTAAEKAWSLKVSAAASFSGNFGPVSASASLKASAGGGEKSNETAGNASLTRNISWQASGGNTLLANNPPAWAPTVAPYQNWRPILQDSLVGIATLLQKMDGFQKTLPALMEALQNAADVQKASLEEAKRVAQKALDDKQLQSLADKEAAERKAAEEKSAADKAAELARIPVADTIVLELTKGASGNTTSGTFLTATAAAFDNITETNRHLSQGWRKIPEWDWWAKVKDGQYYGTCQNRPILTDSNNSGQTFRVYKTDMTAEPQIKYETNYYLKAETPGPNLWVSPLVFNDVTVVAATAENFTSGVRFRNISGGREATVIPSGTAFTMTGLMIANSSNAMDLGQLSHGWQRGDRTDIGLNGDTNMKPCQWTLRRTA